MHTTTSVSRRIKYVLYEIQDEDSTGFTITLLTQLYVRVGILLLSGTHWHDGTILGKVWDLRTNITPFLFKCLYQTRKLDFNVYVLGF